MLISSFSSVLWSLLRGRWTVAQQFDSLISAKATETSQDALSQYESLPTPHTKDSRGPNSKSITMLV